MSGQFFPPNQMALPVPAAVQVPEDQETEVTYIDLDDTRKPVTIAGVTFAPGDTLDLVEFMNSEDEAKRLAFKLSTNRYFKVKGSEDQEKLAAKHERVQAKQAAHIAAVQAKQQGVIEGTAETKAQTEAREAAENRAPEEARLASPSPNPAQIRAANRTPPKQA